MDKNEYLERFRFAILWDEFRRREFPKLTSRRSPSRHDYRRSVLRTHYYRKRQLRLGLNELGLSYWLDGVMSNLHQIVTDTTVQAPFPVDEYDLDTFAFEGLQLCTAGLRKCTEQISNPALKDYCEHLLSVADEVLRELTRRRDEDTK